MFGTSHQEMGKSEICSGTHRRPSSREEGSRMVTQDRRAVRRGQRLQGTTASLNGGESSSSPTSSHGRDRAKTSWVAKLIRPGFLLQRMRERCFAAAESRPQPIIAHFLARMLAAKPKFNVEAGCPGRPRQLPFHQVGVRMDFF